MTVGEEVTVREIMAPATVEIMVLAVPASFKLNQLRLDFNSFPKGEKSKTSIAQDKKRKPTAIKAG